MAGSSPRQINSVTFDLTSREIRDGLADINVNWLIEYLEIYKHGSLSNTDKEFIVFLYLKLGFSKELILYLYEKYPESDKYNTKYLFSVAMDWHKRGFVTKEEVAQYLAAKREYCQAVSKAFNLGRLLGGKEMEYVEKWKKEGFSIDLIREACDRTLSNISKPNFVYADKILSSWKEKGIKTIEELRKDNTEKTHMTKSARNYVNRYSQREYTEEEMKEIETRMLEESIGITIPRKEKDN